MEKMKEALEQAIAPYVEVDDILTKYYRLACTYNVLCDLSKKYFDLSEEVMHEVDRRKYVENDLYQMIHTVVERRKVDTKKLKKENLGLLLKASHIKLAMLEDVIGGETLLKMFVEKVGGIEKALEFIEVNVGEFEKIAGKEEAQKYITVESYRDPRAVCVEKGTYPGDYYEFGSNERTNVYAHNIEDKKVKPISKIKF